jgi:hypothetical protein
VAFSDIEWLSAFTVGSKILLPFGNSTVEVLNHQDTIPRQVTQTEMTGGSFTWCCEDDRRKGMCEDG